ncbi:MAG: Rieske (2Fe-2S) protein [Steroidobacteraceae bacterium]
MSAGWVAAGTIEQLASQSRLEAEVDGEFVAVARLDGQLHAFEDRCTHDGEPLAGAELEGNALRCRDLPATWRTLLPEDRRRIDATRVRTDPDF